MQNKKEEVLNVLEKNENEWVCQLPGGRTIILRFEIRDESEEIDYVDETAYITFWEDDEQLGDSEDFFEFHRTGYLTGIENQSYLIRNIYLPGDLRGTGISQLAVEFFKECTGHALIHARNPNGHKVDDGSQLLEPGLKFIRRMQEIGLIEPFGL